MMGLAPSQEREVVAMLADVVRNGMACPLFAISHIDALERLC